MPVGVSVFSLRLAGERRFKRTTSVRRSSEVGAAAERNAGAGAER